MAERMVHCAKLGRELPAIDETTPEGRSALKLALLIGGPELKKRVHEQVSIDAWRMWKDHMLMVVNEFRLDNTNPESNRILGEQMEAFLFGPSQHVPGYVPPTK